jgi:hypothetical protein
VESALCPHPSLLASLPIIPTYLRLRLPFLISSLTFPFLSAISPSRVLRTLPFVLRTLAHPLVHAAIVACLALTSLLVHILLRLRAVLSRVLLRRALLGHRSAAEAEAGTAAAAVLPWHLRLLDASAHSSMFEDLHNLRLSEVSSSEQRHR